MSRQTRQERFLLLLEEHKKILYKADGVLYGGARWTPLLIVALKGLLGLDAYAIFSSGWLAANVLFGVAVIPLAVWISRRYADRMKRSPLVQGLVRDMAGYNLNAAMGFVGKLEKFEQS